MKRLYKTFLPAITLLLLFNCIPDPEKDLSPDEKDTFSVERDTSIDFSAFKTFFIKDSSRVVQNASNFMDGKGKFHKSNSSDSLIYTTIKEEMEKMGYLLVDSLKDADIGIAVSRVEESYSWEEYHWSLLYPKDYYAYDFFNYFPSPPFPARAGSIKIGMVTGKTNEKNVGLITPWKPENSWNYEYTSTDFLKVIWTGHFTDGQGRNTTEERTIRGIKQLFKQFPKAK